MSDEQSAPTHSRLRRLLLWVQSKVRPSRDPNWFVELCEKHREVWDAAVADGVSGSPGATPREVELMLASNAKDEVARLEAEINLMLVRTSIIVAAATLLFAVYALKPGVQSSAVFLALALCFAAVAFIAALAPMRPPFIRAWGQAYEKRHEWTLQATTPYKSWVLDCWSCDRRTPVAQAYKKAHAVAVPVLLVAAALSAIGLTIGLFS